MEFEENDDRFTLYWKDGHKEVVRGDSISDAFQKAGYSVGALQALDFFSSGACQDYEFNKGTRSWVNARMTIPLVCSSLEPTSAGLHLTGGRSL